MNCKNCQDPLEKDAQFCDNCGAKVIKNRITFKFLITDLFINVFGIDSKFFLTLKKMAIQPNEVINEYLIGVRKRYVNPFAFLAIGAALSVIIYNFYADDFIAIQSSANSGQIEALKETAEIDISTIKDISEKELKKLKSKKQSAKIQLEFMDKMMKFMLRYFNLLTFLFLLLYAILSKWTYRKPHNFGEHIVINAYIYGFTTYFSLVAFFFAMIIHPSIYTFSVLAYIVYYLFAFGKLYNLSIGKSVLKLFRFIIGFALFFIIVVILGAIILIILKSTRLI